MQDIATPIDINYSYFLEICKYIEFYIRSHFLIIWNLWLPSGTNK